MLPGAIAGAVLIPSYHLLADLLGGNQILRSLIQADKNFAHYRPEEREKLVEIFKSRGANIAVSKETKQGITSKVEEVNKRFGEYPEKLNSAIDKAVESHVELKKIVGTIKQAVQANGNQNYDQAQKRLKEDVAVFTRLVDDMGKPQQYYTPEDIMSRVHRLEQRVTYALDRQFELEKTALSDAIDTTLLPQTTPEQKNQIKEELLQNLQKAQEEQKKSILEPMSEAIDAMHKAARAQEAQEFTAMQQWSVLQKISGKNKSNEQTQLATIESDADRTLLTMDNVDMENVLALVHKYNEDAGLKGDDQETFTAKNGQRLKVIKNPDSSFSLEFDLPRRLTNPFYYCSPYNNIKSSTQDAISLYIASGHISKGGVLKLHVKFEDEKTAIAAARDQYLAAIESGLTPENPKQFYLEINGQKLTNEEALKKCFSTQEDQQRLNKCKGIAQRDAQAAEKKWDETKEKFAAYATTPGKVEGNSWKGSDAQKKYKEIKEELIPAERLTERKTELPERNPTQPQV